MATFLDSIGSYLQTGWDQTSHAVYNELGRNIGYYQTDQTLASGHVMLYSGEAVGNPANWQVKNALGVLTSAAQYLTGQGLYPSWQTAADTQAQSDAANAPPFTLPSLPTFSLPNLGSPSGTQLGTVALWAGLGLVSLLVVRKALS